MLSPSKRGGGGRHAGIFTVKEEEAKSEFKHHDRMNNTELERRKCLRKKKLTLRGANQEKKKEVVQDRRSRGRAF